MDKKKIYTHIHMYVYSQLGRWRQSGLQDVPRQCKLVKTKMVWLTNLHILICTHMHLYIFIHPYIYTYLLLHMNTCYIGQSKKSLFVIQRLTAHIHTHTLAFFFTYSQSLHHQYRPRSFDRPDIKYSCIGCLIFTVCCANTAWHR